MKLVRALALSGLLMMGIPAFAAEDNSAAAGDNAQFIAQAHTPSATARINPMTDDQRQKLSALKDKYQLDTAEKKALLQVTQRQLREVMTAVSVDKSAATALQAKINGLRAELSNAKLGFMLAAGDVFTPEQRAAFKEMRGRHGHHGFGGRHGGHGGRGGNCGPGGCGPEGGKGKVS